MICCAILIFLNPIVVWMVLGDFVWPPNVDVALKILKAGVMSGFFIASFLFVRDIFLYLRDHYF